MAYTVFNILKPLAKYAVTLTPYRLHRSGYSNRFQAHEELLLGLKARGYNPSHVIDGGANIGEFAKIVRSVWQSAKIHLVEPQISCKPFLEQLAVDPGFFVHSVALAEQRGVLKMAVEPSTLSTGAHVVMSQSPSDAEISQIEVASETLDFLFAAMIRANDTALLKLDLQGFELNALKGGTTILPRIDAALIEVSFFAQAYEPSIAALVKFFDENGFDLHDIAALSARRRDNRAHQGDFLFVNRTSALSKDTRWG